MNIVFEKIVLNNFLSFKYADLTLNDKGYVVVSGINNYVTDGAKSNGAGKSSIWDAITWCLTGETIRGVKDVVNNLFKDEGCYVELQFSVNGKNYRILRSKDHKEFKTNLKVYVNEEDKSGKGIRDSEKLLSEYLPDLTASFIGSVIILGQGLPERFSNNTPAGRKEILEKLSKSDFMINDIKQSISARQIALQRQLREVQDDSLSLSSKQQLLTAQQATLQYKLDNIGTTDAYKEERQENERKIDEVREELGEFTMEKSMLDLSIQRIRQIYSKFTLEMQQALQEVNDKYDTNIRKLFEEEATLRSQYNALRNEITRIQNIKDICPTCGQKLPEVTKPDTSAQETQAAELQSKLIAIAQQRQQLEQDKAAERSKLEASQKSEQERLIAEGNDLDDKLRKTDTSIVTLKGNKTELENRNCMLKSLIDNFNKNLQELTDTISANAATLVDLSEKLMYNKEKENLISTRLDIVSKMSTIATRDFRGHLLSSIITFIDTTAKTYCKDIFGTEKIGIVLDGNNIEISYDNKVYSGLSGGERQKVDVIVQLSIRDMLSRFMGYTCNILVLDEIFDNLDTYGCDQLLNLFAKKLSDLSSIFIISHHADSLNIPYDTELTIVKNEQGYSEIQ